MLGGLPAGGVAQRPPPWRLTPYLPSFRGQSGGAAPAQEVKLTNP